MQTNVLIFPDELSVERISYLINQKNILPEIAEIDLEMVKMKMRETEEGEGWTAEQCESAEIEYKRYLHLCKIHGKGNVPNKIMDKMWHYHILDTRAYVQDCENIFGGYMHHYPYFGMRGEQDAQNLKNSFEKTKLRYETSFGEPMERDEHTDCWHDCEGRCWHACSDDK
ncbi:MAG: hypothetical protein EAZ85_07960 [Bacteroidetes bacterium]|nr:MAG: hypothetical protein EAZ85_07960 [Bacteroidota bacterium]